MCLLFFFIIIPPPPRSTRPAPLFPYTTLFRSLANGITLGTAGGIVNTSADVTLSGVVDGVGSLVKQGAGILNLTGNNSLSGATVVQEGRLAVNGSIGSSIAAVMSGAEIGGTGTLGGLIVRNNATAAPGTSIGTLSVATFARFEERSE